MKNDKNPKKADTLTLYGITIIMLMVVVWLSVIDVMFYFFGKKSTPVATVEEEVEYVFVLPENAKELDVEQIDEVSFEEPVDFPPTKLIDVPFIYQKDKYPTGCEAVSAVMAMRHAGYRISGKYFITHFLDIAPAPFVDESGKSMGYDPREYFLGNPFSDGGWGCMAPVIEKALNKCVDPSEDTVVNITGTPLIELRSYIDRDVPVIIWGTQGMAEVRPSRTWTIVDTEETFTWTAPNHCLLLVGYDDSGYYFNDPLKHKKCRYPADIVENRYNLKGRQAIIIESVAK